MLFCLPLALHQNRLPKDPHFQILVSLNCISKYLLRQWSIGNQFFLLSGNDMMCHPYITRFFGIGLTPLPATYTCKKLGCTQILLTIIHLILLLNCLDFFDPYYLVIVNVVFVSACLLMHGLLIVGANEKIGLMIHIWVCLTMFCLAYMLYFVWFMAALSFYPKGQLISKCPFGVKTSSKKPMKFFPEFLS